jgi:hypothetical protein
MEIYRGQVKRPCYLSRNDHDCKIMARKQRTDVGKYCFINRTIKMWNKLPNEALKTFPCTSHICRERVRKVITGKK